MTDKRTQALIESISGKLHGIMNEAKGGPNKAMLKKASKDVDKGLSQFQKALQTLTGGGISVAMSGLNSLINSDPKLKSKYERKYSSIVDKVFTAMDKTKAAIKTAEIDFFNLQKNINDDIFKMFDIEIN
jgi:hypothetical protein